jgi:hypothetical protein
VEQVPELIAAGVSCLKIEGRLKGPEYVALTTQVGLRSRSLCHTRLLTLAHTLCWQVYRRAVDATWAALCAEAGVPAISAPTLARAKEAVQLSQEQRWDLEQVGEAAVARPHGSSVHGFQSPDRQNNSMRGKIILDC